MTASNMISQPSPRLTLVTGPSRSGKSEWAEALAAQTLKAVTYVATAQADPTDLEWQARIAQHQRRRPHTWKTIAEPVDLVDIVKAAQPTDCLLVDSLGTWVANLLEQDETRWRETVSDLLDSLVQQQGEVILVAEEAGWGVVPAYPIGRLFRDRLGGLVRQMGAIAGSVYLVTGGHVLNLSRLGSPLSNLEAPGRH